MSDEAGNPLDDMDLVEVYAASSAMGADRIVLMLDDEGIAAQKRESSVAQIPSASTQRHLIIVPSPDKERAQALIKQAILDEVLPGDGAFL